VLTRGEAFGEIALVTNEKRTATVYVRENTEFAAISRIKFITIIKEIRENIREKKIYELKHFKVRIIFFFWKKNIIILGVQASKSFINARCFANNTDKKLPSTRNNI
jgi:hypothetical protein